MNRDAARTSILAILILLSAFTVVVSATSNFDAVASTPSPDNTGTSEYPEGVEFESDIALQNLTVQRYSQTSGGRVVLRDKNHNLIASEAFAGDNATFDRKIQKNTTYYVTVENADGSEYNDAIASTSLPIQGTNLTITAGTYKTPLGDWERTTSTAYNIKQVGGHYAPNTAPSVEAGSESPAGGEVVSTTPIELSLNITDPDFDSGGDSVAVTFYDASDDSVLGTDTLTSNGTATGTFDDPVGGQNEWYAVISDSYGNEITTSTFTFNAPADLEIRVEQDPGSLITNSNVTIEFYPQGSDASNIVEREATNGVVDMTGLDANTEFIAVASADGYETRRIYIESLIKTQTVYLVNENADTVSVEFEVDDFSGRFQQADSVLVIEREIDGSFTPIQGDFFGAAGRYEAALVRDVRHRLRIRNLETGDEEVIGTFTPQSAGLQTLTIEPSGEVTITRQFEQVFADPALGVIPASETASFGVELREGNESINSYEITVEHIAPDGNETTLATRTGSGSGVERFTLNLTGREGIVQATVVTETDAGERTTLISRDIRESYPGANGLLGGLNDIGAGLNAGDGSSGVSSLLSFFLSLLITAGVGARSGSSELSGLAALGSLTGFAVIGWLSMQVLFASAVGFGAVMLLRRGI